MSNNIANIIIKENNIYINGKLIDKIKKYGSLNNNLISNILLLNINQNIDSISLIIEDTILDKILINGNFGSFKINGIIIKGKNFFNFAMFKDIDHISFEDGKVYVNSAIFDRIDEIYFNNIEINGELSENFVIYNSEFKKFRGWIIFNNIRSLIVNNGSNIFELINILFSYVDIVINNRNVDITVKLNNNNGDYIILLSNVKINSNNRNIFINIYSKKLSNIGIYNFYPNFLEYIMIYDSDKFRDPILNHICMYSKLQRNNSRFKDFILNYVNHIICSYKIYNVSENCKKVKDIVCNNSDIFINDSLQNIFCSNNINKDNKEQLFYETGSIYGYLKSFLEKNELYTYAGNVHVNFMNFKCNNMDWYWKIIFRIYNVVSRYGESVYRPLCVFGCVILLMIMFGRSYLPCILNVGAVNFGTYLGELKCFFYRAFSIILLGISYIALRRKLERRFHRK